jgi:uncharacterized protein (TIRG00374 family)
MVIEKPILKIVRDFNFRDAVGFLFSGVLLWYMFYKSGLRLSDIKLKGDQWYYFGGAIAVFVFSLWLYSLRAKLIWVTEAKKGIKLETYSSLILGNFYNCLLPGNLGEGVRASHFSRKNKITFSCSLSAIITEKWLDAQVFGALVSLLFCIKPFYKHVISYALAYVAITVLFLSVIHLALRRNPRLEKNLWFLVLYLGKTGRFLYKLYYHTDQHLKEMSKNAVVRSYVLYFGLIFFLNVLQFYFLEQAAGVCAPIAGMYSSFLISLSMMIIAFIPSAPSNIGVLHYGVYSALILVSYQYGTHPSSADLQSFALFSVYAHLSFLLPEIMMGSIFMIKEKKALF